jgi:hypothetical protein
MCLPIKPDGVSLYPFLCGILLMIQDKRMVRAVSDFQRLIHPVQSQYVHGLAGAGPTLVSIHV